MQYLCVPFTFQSISAYLIHIVPPRFKQKIEDFVAPAWQKLVTPISTFKKNGPCMWSTGQASTNISWIRMAWVSKLSCPLGQGKCNIHHVLTDIHASAHVRTHIHARTRAREHTHTYTHSLSCSLTRWPAGSRRQGQQHSFSRSWKLTANPAKQPVHRKLRTGLPASSYS